jgi:hypothetical protein
MNYETRMSSTKVLAAGKGLLSATSLGGRAKKVERWRRKEAELALL